MKGLAVILAASAALLFYTGCTTSPGTPNDNPPQNIINVPGDGTAALDSAAMEALQNGDPVTITASNGKSYTVRFISNGSDPDILTLQDSEGVITYFHKDVVILGDVTGFWVAYQQKQGETLKSIVTDPANRIFVTIGQTGSFAIGSIGTPVFVPPTTPPTDPGLLADMVDSLFQVLIQRVQSIENTSSFYDFTAIDFMSLRDAFDAVIVVAPGNQKANVGCMVSSMLSLNANQEIQKMVDSLDAYYDAINNDTTLNKNGGLFKRTYARGGVTGLGKALAARTPDMARALAQEPTFPRFITLSYIQGIAETDMIPVLDKMIAAGKRLEALSDVAIPVYIEGETDTFDMDKGEIYAFTAMCYLTKAYMEMYCTYNFDLYAPGTTNYSWVDSLYNSSSASQYSYNLSGDTLYKIYMDDYSQTDITMCKMFKYNLGRSDFMTIRRPNHAQAKTDFLAVASQIKEGLAYIRNESDVQTTDIIRLSDITNADEQLAGFRDDLIAEGISAGLANKLSSPDSIADFVADLLNGPYTFDELIDSTQVQFTVDLSAFFDHPVTDLRSLLPWYTWTAENTWKVREMDYQFIDPLYSTDNTFTVYDETAVVNINQSLIDSIVPDRYGYGYQTYYLNVPINYEATIDSSVFIDPLRLLDANKEIWAPETMDSLVTANAFFPYFTDYTFNGMLPGMTRQKWLDLIYPQ